MKKRVKRDKKSVKRKRSWFFRQRSKVVLIWSKNCFYCRLLIPKKQHLQRRRRRHRQDEWRQESSGLVRVLVARWGRWRGQTRSGGRWHSNRISPGRSKRPWWRQVGQNIFGRTKFWLSQFWPSLKFNQLLFMTCGAVVECKPCDQVVTVPSPTGAWFFPLMEVLHYWFSFKMDAWLSSLNRNPWSFFSILYTFYCSYYSSNFLAWVIFS